MKDAHVGQLRVSWGVTNGRIATARVPAQKSAFAERHADKRFQSAGEVQMLRKRGDDLRATVIVDDSGRTQKGSVRLAVVAIADGSHRRPRWLDIALKRPAATPKWMIHDAR